MWESPQSEANPTPAKEPVKDALREAMRKSQFKAKDHPAPAAGPEIAATTGALMASKASTMGLYSSTTLPIPCPVDKSWRCSLRSCPTQKDFPSAVINTARMLGSVAASNSSRSRVRSTLLMALYPSGRRSVITRTTPEAASAALVCCPVSTSRFSTPTTSCSSDITAFLVAVGHAEPAHRTVVWSCLTFQHPWQGDGQ